MDEDQELLVRKKHHSLLPSCFLEIGRLRDIDFWSIYGVLQKMLKFSDSGKNTHVNIGFKNSKDHKD